MSVTMTPIDAPFGPITEGEYWRRRAEECLERALDEIRSGEDPSPATTEALAALYRWDGEAPDWVRLQAADLEYESESGPVCICPPDLLARGGFRGGCHVHG